MALIDNIIAYWKNDEASEADNTDSVGSADLTLFDDGTPIGRSTGLINLGSNFSASDTIRYEYNDTTGLFAFTGAFSVSFWFKKTDGTGANLISKNSEAGGSRYGFGVTCSTSVSLRIEIAITPTFVDLETSTPITYDTWHHVVATVDGSGNAKLYYDGTLEDSASGATPFWDSTTYALDVGAGWIGSGYERYLTGMMDEMGIWDRELSGSEVTQLYNGGNGNQYPFSVPPSTNTSNFFQLF